MQAINFKIRQNRKIQISEIENFFDDAILIMDL